MSFKWKNHCTIHGWVYEWQNTPLNQCPINATDQMTPGMLRQIGQEKQVASLIPTEYKTSSSSFMNTLTYHYLYSQGPLYRVKILSSITPGGDGTYTVQVADRDTATVMTEPTYSNIGPVELQDLGLLTPPDEDFTLEINLKKTTGASGEACITQVILLTRVESE